MTILVKTHAIVEVSYLVNSNSVHDAIDAVANSIDTDRNIDPFLSHILSENIVSGSHITEQEIHEMVREENAFNKEY